MSTTISWASLSERQRHYLKTLFHLDQAREAEHNASWRHDRFPQNIPARQWRSVAPKEFIKALGKLPKNEAWDTVVRELEDLWLIDTDAEGDEEPQKLWITSAGRRVVRKVLALPTTALTNAQERYALRIANAGIAPLEEVRAAFLDKTPSGQERIEAWRSLVAAMEREKREAAEQREREERTRREPCAFPGCNQEIEVVLTTLHDWLPAPVLVVAVRSEVPGWHYERDPRTGRQRLKPNNAEQFFRFYGCSTAHREAIARMGIQVTLVPNEKAEQTLASVGYAVSLSLEARFAVGELAARTARDMVARMPPGQEVSTEKSAINAEIKRQIARLTDEATQAGKELTDDLPRFRRLYGLSFRAAWLSAVAARQREP